MKRSRRFTFVLGSCLALALLAARPRATGDDDRKDDFGLFIADQLRDHSEQLFGISRPLAGVGARPLRWRRQHAGDRGCSRPEGLAGLELGGIRR